MSEEQSQASWKNRRRMAWGSFFLITGFLLGICYALFIRGDDPTAWTGILTILLGGVVTIVVGYTGFAAWEDVTKLKK